MRSKQSSKRGLAFEQREREKKKSAFSLLSSLFLSLASSVSFSGTQLPSMLDLHRGRAPFPHRLSLRSSPPKPLSPSSGAFLLTFLKPLRRQKGRRNQERGKKVSRGYQLGCHHRRSSTSSSSFPPSLFRESFPLLFLSLSLTHTPSPSSSSASLPISGQRELRPRPLSLQGKRERRTYIFTMLLSS